MQFFIFDVKLKINVEIRERYVSCSTEVGVKLLLLIFKNVSLLLYTFCDTEYNQIRISRITLLGTVLEQAILLNHFWYECTNYMNRHIMVPVPHCNLLHIQTSDRRFCYDRCDVGVIFILGFNNAKASIPQFDTKDYGK